MSNFTDEEKAAILRRAREIPAQPPASERTGDVGASELPTPSDYLPPFEDRTARWQREGDERMARQEQARRERDYAAIEARITTNVLATMQGVVDAEHARMVEGLLPEVLFALRQEISDEICTAIESACAKAFADVRADLNALRQAVTKVADDGAIIDLPPLPSMRGVELN